MIRVRGHSDDIVQIEGDGFLEEFYPSGRGDDKPSYLAFSDGTLLSVQYTREGMWRLNRLATGRATYEKIEATGPEGEYSDVVTLDDGGIEWVVFGGGLQRKAKAKGK